MPHVTPQLKGQRITYHRHVVIWCQQYPLAVCRHTQQTHVKVIAVVIARLNGILLLVETQRTVATQLDADRAVIALGLHVSFHLLLSTSTREKRHGSLKWSRRGDGYLWQSLAPQTGDTCNQCHYYYQDPSFHISQSYSFSFLQMHLGILRHRAVSSRYFQSMTQM